MPAGAEPDSGPGPGYGLMAGTPVGRALLSVLLATATLTLVVWNVPEPFGLRDDLRPIVRPYVHALAIDQNWELFSPNPSVTSIEVVADVTLADGSTARYEFPGGEPVIGAYRQYHWRKYLRRLRLDDNRRLWAPAAAWVASGFDEPVTEVVLVRRFAKTPEPGSNDRYEWTEVEFYRWTPVDA